MFFLVFKHVVPGLLLCPAPTQLLESPQSQEVGWVPTVHHPPVMNNGLRTSLRLWVLRPENKNKLGGKKSNGGKDETHTKQNKNQTACPRRGERSLLLSFSSQTRTHLHKVFPEAGSVWGSPTHSHLQLASPAGHCGAPGAIFPTGTQAEEREGLYGACNCTIFNIRLGPWWESLLLEKWNHMCSNPVSTINSHCDMRCKMETVEADMQPWN